MKKIFAAVALAAIAIAMFAGPAAADGADVAVYQGFADVGSAFALKADGSSTCDATGNGVVTGHGLNFPAPIGPANVTGTWKLSTTTLQSALHGPGTLTICGYLRPEPNTGIGASCGISQGYGGQGVLISAGGVHAGGELGLSDVGWVTSAGGTLPTTGKTATGGDLVSVTQAQGGQACLDAANGAKQFAVVGVSAITG
jgi:hypothetical protein